MPFRTGNHLRLLSTRACSTLPCRASPTRIQHAEFRYHPQPAAARREDELTTGPRNGANLGLAIERDQFDEGDYERFSTRLTQCLDALEALLKRPGFGEGELSLGAELELSLVDRHACPCP